MGPGEGDRLAADRPANGSEWHWHQAKSRNILPQPHELMMGCFISNYYAVSVVRFSLVKLMARRYGHVQHVQP